MNYIIAAAVGYISGIFLGYSVKKRIVFRESHDYSMEMRKYILVYSSSLAVGLGLLGILAYQGTNVLIAYVLVMFLTATTNYFGIKFFVFGRTEAIKKMDFFIYKYRYLITYIVIGLGSIFVEVFLIDLLEDSHSNLYSLRVLGFVVGVLFSFMLNVKLNFDVPKKQKWGMFNLFMGISIFAFILNLLLIKIISWRTGFANYPMIRFVSAAIVFGMSYTLHRKITFKGVKKVGVAVYLAEKEDVASIKNEVMYYPDFIHLDLVDKTFNPGAREVDLSKGEDAKKYWSRLRSMTHIMSSTPSKWIKKVARFSDFIIIHTEISEDVGSLLKEIENLGKKRGVSILYNTPLGTIRRYLKDIDIIQILGIPQPGESNQHMEEKSILLLDELNKLRKKYNFDVCFDGGVKIGNIHRINAEYIVSGSAVLDAENKRDVIYAMKTNARYYYAKDRDLKEYLRKEILNILEKIDYVVSGTLVGSFVEKSGMEGVGDIDIVVIIDELRKKKFEGLLQEFEELKKRAEVDFDRSVIINTTLGPLKFNTSNNVVFHVMIYDIKGHIMHCRKSPFTCMDWQRSNVYVKRHMSEIYKVSLLKPRDFFGSRRGINDYMKDVVSEKLSYREYIFENGKAREKVSYKEMDSKDKFEFAYHIMRFCMVNLLKLIHKNNASRRLDEMLGEYFRIAYVNKELHYKFFMKIKGFKEENNFPEWNKEYEDKLKKFMKDFEDNFKRIFFDESKRIYLIRHQKTRMNKKDAFLGQRLDPSIKINKKEIQKKFLDIAVDKIFCSPLKRSIETSKTIKAEKGLKELVIEDNLKEIDYGKIDGKSYNYLKEKYPRIIEDWEKGLDPRFPDGENLRDVFNRAKNVLKSILNNHQFKSCIICTHSVVLRCIIGWLYRIPIRKWHFITIKYIEPYELIAVRGRIYSNISLEQEEFMLDKVLRGKK